MAVPTAQLPRVVRQTRVFITEANPVGACRCAAADVRCAAKVGHQAGTGRRSVEYGTEAARVRTVGAGAIDRAHAARVSHALVEHHGRKCHATAAGDGHRACNSMWRLSRRGLKSNAAPVCRLPTAWARRIPGGSDQSEARQRYSPRDRPGRARTHASTLTRHCRGQLASQPGLVARVPSAHRASRAGKCRGSTPEQLDDQAGGQVRRSEAARPPARASRQTWR
eukprot:scaffold10720_cov69-Phaeocystis_antarctica.AAC.7